MIDMIADNANPDNEWNRSILLGIHNVPIPDDYSNIVMPLRAIQNANQIGSDTYLRWLNEDNHAEIFRVKNSDPALPLYISQAISSDLQKLGRQSANLEYENFFSLTYAKKSLLLGVGFSDFVVDKYNNENLADVLLLLLNIAGPYDIQELGHNEAAVILSTLKSYKLDNHAIALAFEYLQ
jgi:hypothetical protein